MKVFLSWSGALSHKMACTLRDWLPSVIQSLRPYVSSEDIDKGARWSTDIAKELEEASYGIVCVTLENLHAPWVHFEAGALSKSLDKANVVPFLFDIKRSDVQGPLLQFQSVVFDRADIDKLLQGLNKKLPDKDRLPEHQLDRTFDVWWPQLKESLDALARERSTEERPPRSDARAHKDEILEELLELARNQQRLLNSPETLLPSQYLRSIIRDLDITSARRLERLEIELDRLHSEMVALEPVFEKLSVDHAELAGVTERLQQIHRQLHHVRGGGRLAHRGVWDRQRRLLDFGDEDKTGGA